jgi:16S rRNA (guanine527-N7)-methyltransferase
MDDFCMVTVPPFEELAQLQETLAFLEQAEALGLPVSQDQLKAIHAFYRLLLAKNEVMNLTRITAWPDFLIRHVLESLLYSLFITPKTTVLDLGSGGGFPLMPLALYRPDVTFHSLESVKKKATYLSETAEALQLKNVKVYAERAEHLGHHTSHRGRYDVVTSRAVAALPVLTEYCLPFLKTDGIMLALKGPSWEDEMRRAEVAIETLGAEFSDVYWPEGHPGLEDTCFMVQLVKVARTPKGYPRPAGLAAKEPIT